MKVIKKGYVKPNNRVECIHCGCIYEYEPDDVAEERQEWQEFDSSLYMNQWHYIAMVKVVHCPTCNRTYEIDRNIISAEIIPFR